MVSNFVCVFFLGWTFLGDTLTKTVNEDITQRQKLMDDHYALLDETLQKVIECQQLTIDTPSLLKEIKTEYNTLGEQVLKAKEMKAKQGHRDLIIQRLQALKQREESEKSSYQTSVYDKTLAHVTKSFASLPKQQKDLLVDYAVSVVGGDAKPLDSKVDPVKKLFRDYLNSKAYDKEIEADRAAERAKLTKA